MGLYVLFVVTYIGRVPNCERCQDCFFQWPEVIGNLSLIVDNLQYQITSLILTYYNNHTVSSVETEIMMLLDQLILANQILNSITIQETDIDNLNQVLSYVSTCMKLYACIMPLHLLLCIPYFRCIYSDTSKFISTLYADLY